jgi:hypothetical protein
MLLPIVERKEEEEEEHPSPKSEINVIPLRFNRNSSGQHVGVHAK